jgi:hypothetical protein
MVGTDLVEVDRLLCVGELRCPGQGGSLDEGAEHVRAVAHPDAQNRQECGELRQEGHV